MNNYFRDLANRQNRSVTSAQLHLFINAKRYYKKDLEEFINLTKDDKSNNESDEKIDELGSSVITHQVDLENNKLYNFIHPDNKEDGYCEIQKRYVDVNYNCDKFKIVIDRDICYFGGYVSGEQPSKVCINCSHRFISKNTNNKKETMIVDVIKNNLTLSKAEEQFLSRYFVYQNKLVLLDDSGNNIVLKAKSDLFDNLIIEFSKMCDWLDKKCAVMRFVDIEGKICEITPEEIRTTVSFLDKLNKIPKD